MKRLIYIIFTIVIMAGCSDDLDLAPKSEISDVTFWKSANDFRMATNNLYFFLEGWNFNDFHSDIAYGLGPDPISNGSYVPYETTSLWNTPYDGIRAANVILEKVETYTGSDDITAYVGEAYFFRAYEYWRLFKLFGGVPIIDKVLDINSEELYKARNSRSETVEFMLEDLDAAIQRLPNKSDLSASDVGRITKGAALALKARVALFEGTWAKYHGTGANVNELLATAAEAAKEVIDSKEYELFTGQGDESYRYLFIEEGDDSPENILDRRYHRDISEQDFGYWVSYNNSPTKKLADMYLSADGLPISMSPLFQGYDDTGDEFIDRDPRMTMTFIIPGKETVRPHHPTTPVENWPGVNDNRNTNTGYLCYKFLSEDVFGNTYWGKHNFDWHLIRYAEVLLIYAEATYELNGSISDADLNNSINLLRERVNMPPLTNAFVTANGLDMLTEIRRERTIELAFESFRYDDLRRWKTAETEMPMPVKGIKIGGTAWESIPPYDNPALPKDNDGFLIVESNRKFEPKHYLRPIPTKEISVNDELQQNPSW